MSSPLLKSPIIIAPFFTERSLAATADHKYTFRVETFATKNQIRQAIEELFSVDVVAIHTTIKKDLKFRSRKTGKYQKKKGYKKAIVEIKPNQKIELFSSLEK